MGQELPLKVLEVDQAKNRLVVSNRRAMVEAKLTNLCVCVCQVEAKLTNLTHEPDVCVCVRLRPSSRTWSPASS